MVIGLQWGRDLVAEHGPEPGERLMGLALDGPLRATQQVSDLGDGEVLVETENDDGALSAWEPADLAQQPQPSRLPQRV